jgi:hypothetical protein
MAGERHQCVRRFLGQHAHVDATLWGCRLVDLLARLVRGEARHGHTVAAALSASVASSSDSSRPP